MMMILYSSGQLHSSVLAVCANLVLLIAQAEPHLKSNLQLVPVLSLLVLLHKRACDHLNKQ